jgi:hypothetical protein
MNKLKSVGTVLAGFITVVVLSVATDFLMEALEVFTPPGEGFFTTWMLVIALIYRMIYTIAGGYITARLAPAQPMNHVTVLGIIGVVAGSWYNSRVEPTGTQVSNSSCCYGFSMYMVGWKNEKVRSEQGQKKTLRAKLIRFVVR